MLLQHPISIDILYGLAIGAVIWLVGTVLYCVFLFIEGKFK